MNAWQKLAWIEWYRSFRLTGKDNHDFFWLALLLFLTLTLALLLWGSREGLLNKFVDVSLGRLEGVGIPIWVAANNEEGLDRQLLQTAGIQFYPYREVESFEASLPINTKPIWDNKVPFEGWAVSSIDPLWQLGVNNQVPTVTTQPFPVPLEIILSNSLFKQYFNCAAYVAAVQQQLPFWSPPVTTKANPLFCLADNILWLDVKVGTERRELLPFHIHWQPRIPTMHQLAFLLPLSTLHALKVSTYFTNLKYYPEAQLDKQPRIKELMLWTDIHGVTPSVRQLEHCLKHVQIIDNNRINLDYPLPRTWVMSCIKQSGILLQSDDKPLSLPYLTITEESESHYFQYDDKDYLTISCGQTQPRCQPCEKVIQSPVWRSLTTTVCTQTQTIADMIGLIGSYQKALTYVKNRDDLATYLDKITNLPQSATDGSKAFYIHPTYHDAHVRFLFIQKVIEMLKMVYSPFFLMLLLILLVVQIGIVITHRQHNYGILLAKGMSWQQIYYLILMQITLSFIIAWGGALLLIESVSYLLSWRFAGIVTQKPYIDHLLVNNFDLLPLTFIDYGLVSLMCLGMSYLMATVMLRRTIARQPLEPAYLFKL
jgi:hypothetical protein